MVLSEPDENVVRDVKAISTAGFGMPKAYEARQVQVVFMGFVVMMAKLALKNKS